jgi:hypothetical protein
MISVMLGARAMTRRGSAGPGPFGRWGRDFTKRSDDPAGDKLLPSIEKKVLHNILIFDKVHHLKLLAFLNVPGYLLTIKKRMAVKNISGKRTESRGL